MPTINLGRKKRRETTTRSKQYAKLYGNARWKRLRAYKLSENPLCEDCFKRDVITQASEVHHIKPVDPDDPNYKELLYDWDNLQSLCVTCHRTIQYQLNK